MKIERIIAAHALLLDKRESSDAKLLKCRGAVSQKTRALRDMVQVEREYVEAFYDLLLATVEQATRYAALADGLKKQVQLETLVITEQDQTVAVLERKIDLLLQHCENEGIETGIKRLNYHYS